MPLDVTSSEIAYNRAITESVAYAFKHGDYLIYVPSLYEPYDEIYADAQITLTAIDEEVKRLKDIIEKREVQRMYVEKYGNALPAAFEAARSKIDHDVPITNEEYLIVSAFCPQILKSKETIVMEK